MSNIFIKEQISHTEYVEISELNEIEESDNITNLTNEIIRVLRLRYPYLIIHKSGIEKWLKDCLKGNDKDFIFMTKTGVSGELITGFIEYDGE